MKEYSLIVLVDCCTSFEGVFVNKWSYCWFPRDVMGVTLDDTNKSILLHWELKVARYSFSGSMPPKFEHKLHRQKQSFGKIATTVVLDKDENLL